MPDLTLTLSVDPNWDMLGPLIEGKVKADGIKLEYNYHHGIFYTQLKFNRFDVAEMSFSSYLMARAKGWPFKALPVFVNRQFAWTTLVVHKGAGIDEPGDLRGKRIGTGDYQQTAAVWARGALHHDFGVRPEEMVWYMERTPRFSHGGAIGGFIPPQGLRFHYAEKPFDEMILGGELDAAHYQSGGQQVIRSDVDLFHHPDCKMLFADRKAEGIRFYRKHGIFPPHHLIVVRESILGEHPWVATSLLEAFENAKRLWMDPVYRRLTSNNRTLSVLVFGRDDLEEQRKIFGDDPFPYGIRANAKAIDMMQTLSVEQGLTSKKQPLEELFPEEILIAEEKMSG